MGRDCLEFGSPVKLVQPTVEPSLTWLHTSKPVILQVKKLTNPVKNVTWVLMEIPCHANFTSQLDLVAVWSKSTPNSMTFPCHLSRFYLFAMGHDMDFGQGQIMEFPCHLLRKWWDFHRIWSHLRTKPNCRRSKRHEKVRVTFCTGRSTIFHVP